jgi:aminoglycoside/choline kinase family phosphotransferase
MVTARPPAVRWGRCEVSDLAADLSPRIDQGLTRLGRPVAGWVRLAGDASVRRFYRLAGVHGNPPEILMDAGEAFVAEDDPFCLTARFLKQSNLPVPKIRGVDGEAGLVLLEDLGDSTLESCFSGDRREQLYQAAVDLAAGLQSLDPVLLPEALPARRLFFDEKKLLWELHFFHRHFFGGLLGITLPTEDEQTLQGFYRHLCSRVAGFRPRVFCHRDFHSRNLMVTGGRLVMVDFQDARLGPETYDLVSLLRDCYVEVGEDLERRLIDRYLQLRAPAEDEQGFQTRFEATALQRGIKAAGTFSFQAAEKGNRRYLASMPLTARNLGRAFGALPEYEKAGRIILPRLSAL